MTWQIFVNIFEKKKISTGGFFVCVKIFFYQHEPKSLRVYLCLWKWNVAPEMNGTKCVTIRAAALAVSGEFHREGPLAITLQDVQGPLVSHPRWPVVKCGGTTPHNNTSQQHLTTTPHNNTSQQHLTTTPHNNTSQQHLTTTPHNNTSQQHLTTTPHNNNNTSQQHLTTTPHNNASQQHLTTTPHNNTSQQHLTTTPHNNTSQQHLTTTPHNNISQQHLTTTPHNNTSQQHLTTTPHNNTSQQHSSQSALSDSPVTIFYFSYFIVQLDIKNNY